jgi:IS4 transposase
MPRRVVAVLLAIACTAAVVLPAFAQEPGATKFKGGFYERLRHEFWKNNRDMENRYYDGGDRNFYRLKTSVWARWTMNSI